MSLRIVVQSTADADQTSVQEPHNDPCGESSCMVVENTPQQAELNAIQADGEQEPVQARYTGSFSIVL